MKMILTDGTEKEIKLPVAPRILIIRRNGIGDLLTAIPLLVWCKRNLQAKITLVVEHGNNACAQWVANPPWDELIVIPKGNKIMTALKLILKIRGGCFDLAVNAKVGVMHLMTAVIALSNAKVRRCGIQGKGWSKCFEPMVNAPFSAASLRSLSHQADQTFHILAPRDSVVTSDLYAKMKTPPQSRIDQFESECVAQGVGRTGESKRILINITNNRAASKPGLNQLTEALSGIPQCHVILLAIKSDEAQLMEWKNALKQKLTQPVAAILSHDFPYGLAAIQASDLILTGDGGFMHMSAACDRRVLALFGKTSVEKWRPLSDSAECLFHAESASEISPAAIAESISRMLSATQP